MAFAITSTCSSRAGIPSASSASWIAGRAARSGARSWRMCWAVPSSMLRGRTSAARWGVAWVAGVAAGCWDWERPGRGPRRSPPVVHAPVPEHTARYERQYRRYRELVPDTARRDAMRHKIAVIPGDGIGNEVVPEGMRVLEAAGRRFGFECAFTHFDWNCERFTKTGRMMPEDGLDQLRAFEAIFLGAVGIPGRARPRLPLGTSHPHPAELPPVHQPAPGAAAQGRAVAPGGTDYPPTSTCSSCGRTTRASTRRSAGGSSAAPTTRWRFSRRSSPGKAATG